MRTPRRWLKDWIRKQDIHHELHNITVRMGYVASRGFGDYEIARCEELDAQAKVLEAELKTL